MLYTLAKIIVKFLCVLFLRVEVVGLYNMPQNGGIIVCSNHKSYIDPPFLTAYLNRRLSFMAKKSLFSNAFLGYILKKLRAFPVNRGGSDISAIKTAIEIVNNGNALLIFPEGTRSKSGELLKFKNGASLIASKTNAVIVPVAIVGSYKLFSKMKVIIGKPILNTENLNEILYNKISDMLRS